MIMYTFFVKGLGTFLNYCKILEPNFGLCAWIPVKEYNYTKNRSVWGKTKVVTNPVLCKY